MTTLDQDNVLSFLLSRGWIHPKQAVDGLQIVQGDRRHRHFRVETQGDSPGLFVKQVLNWDSETIRSLQKEALCYRLAASEPDFQGLRHTLPSFRGYDPRNHILATGLFAQAQNLTQFHGHKGDAPESLADELGRVLGQWHRDLRLQPTDPRLGGLFPGKLPWILQLHRSPNPRPHPQGAGAGYVADTLQQDPVLFQAMDQLAAGYRPSCLIHGDIKWDNLLTTTHDSTLDHGPAVRLVDWEIADVGDPLWDAAGVLQSYLMFWLLSMPLNSGMTARQMEQQASFPLERMQPALGAFWRAYAEQRNLEPEVGREALLSTLRYTAARLVQSTYEAGVVYKSPLPQLRYLMQLSQSTLLQTENAVHDLLGM